MSRVVVFSGGRGATTIIASLARTRGVDLTVIVNAYDAGLSTGRVRRAIPGMLGPSDIRKTAGSLAIAAGDDAARRLAKLLEYRLATDEGIEAKRQFEALRSGALEALDPALGAMVSQLSVATWRAIRDYLDLFELHLSSKGVEFDFNDLAIGNAVLAGCFLMSDGDMNRAVDCYNSMFDMSSSRVLNVNAGEDLWLTASAGRWLCLDEGSLVTADAPAPIDDLYLLDRASFDRLAKDREGWVIAPDLTQQIATAERLPTINPAARSAIGAADVILYGPGTQHSSLFPTYLTVSLGESIAANQSAEKIFVANLIPDHDQHEYEGLSDVLAKFQYFTSRRQSLAVEDIDLISSVLVNESDGALVQGINPSIPVRRAVWADPSGRHSGSAVLEEIASVVRMRSGVQLGGDAGLLSIIVPVLDEAPRVRNVLQQLRYLDLTGHGLAIEIVAVDGGSRDGTLEILHSEPDIRVIEVVARGRGEAIHAGIQAARGEFVVVFPADEEYDTAAIVAVVSRLLEDPTKAVVASRTLGGSSAEQRLRAVYGQQRFLYLLSHWGGVFLTLLFMLRLDRIISDPISIVRGARRDVFRRLDNDGRSIDYEAKWITRAVEIGCGPVDVAVDYRPRGWKEGKKTNVIDGLRALRVVLFERTRQRGGR